MYKLALQAVSISMLIFTLHSMEEKKERKEKEIFKYTHAEQVYPYLPRQLVSMYRACEEQIVIDNRTRSILSIVSRVGTLGMCGGGSCGGSITIQLEAQVAPGQKFLIADPRMSGSLTIDGFYLNESYDLNEELAIAGLSDKEMKEIGCEITFEEDCYTPAAHRSKLKPTHLRLDKIKNYYNSTILVTDREEYRRISILLNNDYRVQKGE